LVGLITVFFVFGFFGLPRNREQAKIEDPKLLSFKSKTMDETREYYFRASKRSGQPLMLLLDSEWKIGRSLKIIDYYRKNVDSSFDPTIVGLKNTNRFRDVTPTVTEDPNYPKTGGGADRFIKFILEELMPRVESQLNKPYGAKIIVGHSGSGLFVSYLFLQRPNSFDYYLPISPSLHYDFNYTLKKAKTDLLKEYSDQKIFFSVGSLEPAHMIKNCETFTNLLEKTKPGKLRWGLKVIEGETHGSTYEKSFFEGLNFFFR